MAIEEVVGEVKQVLTEVGKELTRDGEKAAIEKVGKKVATGMAKGTLEGVEGNIDDNTIAKKGVELAKAKIGAVGRDRREVVPGGGKIDKVDFSKMQVNPPPEMMSPLGITWVGDQLHTTSIDDGISIEYQAVEVRNPETEKIETHYFPDFSKVSVPPGVEFELPQTEWGKSHSSHETTCNNELNKWCQNNPEQAKKIFSPEQLKQISEGKTPKGYTWHHTERPGKMQLVPTRIHEQCRHTGGQAIWGNKVPQNK